jgi:hypothetical protein
MWWTSFLRHLLPNSSLGAGTVSGKSVTVWDVACCEDPLTKTGETGRLRKTVRQHLLVYLCLPVHAQETAYVV